MFDAGSALGRSAPLAQDRPSQPTLGDGEPGKSVKPKLLLVNKPKAGTSKGRVGAQHEPPSWTASVAENDSRSGGRKAATRLPGRFDNDDASSPLSADSPANIFVLKGMQPLSKHAEPPMPPATSPAPHPLSPTSGVGDLGRTGRLLLQSRSSELYRGVRLLHCYLYISIKREVLTVADSLCLSVDARSSIGYVTNAHSVANSIASAVATCGRILGLGDTREGCD